MVFCVIYSLNSSDRVCYKTHRWYAIKLTSFDVLLDSIIELNEWKGFLYSNQRLKCRDVPWVSLGLTIGVYTVCRHPTFFVRFNHQRSRFKIQKHILKFYS